MERVLVSACLLGAKVRYHGGDAAVDDPILRRWRDEGRLVAACPEQDGGLPTPRPPAEIVGDGGAAVIARAAVVRTTTGVDVTEAFRRGAEIALAVAKQHGIRVAVLKDGSPSCGTTQIHDGSFSGTKIPGAGVTASLLQANGVRVFDETQTAEADALIREMEGAR